MMLSGHEHALLFERVCARACVRFCDLTGKSFWSGRNTTKEPLTDVSIIEEQLMLLCFNLTVHE